MSASNAHAFSQGTDVTSLIEQLMKQISQLQSQLKGNQSLGNTEKTVQVTPLYSYTQTDDGKPGRSKITIKKPTQHSTFYKSDPNDPVLVTWETKNIPEDSVVEVELDGIELNEGGVAGGTWRDTIPQGDSIGSYEWTIYGEGYSTEGTYRVRTIVRACHSDGCEVNPDFPDTKEKVKTYAKSAWRMLTILNDEESEFLSDFKGILNGRTVETESDVTEKEADELCTELFNDYETYNYEYGDVLKCYWRGDKFKTVSQWKG